jgi:hypothetical protein
MIFSDQWQEMPDVEPLRNGYRAGWELFLKHVAEDAPFPAPFLPLNPPTLDQYARAHIVNL